RLPGAQADQHRRRRDHGDRGAAGLRHRLHHQQRPQRARAAVGARDRQHHRRGEPGRVRVGDRRHPADDLDHPDLDLRRERVRGEADVSAVTVEEAPRRNRKRLTPGRVLLHVFLITFAVLWIVPVGWAFFTSFRSYADTAVHGYVSWPHHLTL